MGQFPLPNPPAFRVTESSPGAVKLDWGDFPPAVKAGHALAGYRLYRSATKDELGAQLAEVGPSTFQYIDTTPGAGASQHYTLVAVESWGYGAQPFGAHPYGSQDHTGLGRAPFNRRPHGSPRRGWGRGAWGDDGYGL